MTVIYRSGDILQTENNTVALGTFDGLHLGHMEIIKKAVCISEINNAKSGVMFFDCLPSKAFGKSVCHLMNNEEKIKLLDTDFIYEQRFDSDFRDMSPEEFVLYMKNVLKAGCVCAGYNYRFGKNAAGDSQMLEKLCGKYGISTQILPEFMKNGKKVSSTEIRNYLSCGDIESANELLGRPYTVSGTVGKGLQNGRKFGIPTANISYESGKQLPSDGVYSGYVYVNDKKYLSVINVGKNPTFNAGKITVEPHILDFDGEIYGENITAEFHYRIRGEIKFDNVDDLKKQINSDIEKCRKDLII